MDHQQNKLFFVILGATPPGRLIEQHDVFFGIGSSLEALVPQMKASWPEAKGKIHIDAWREVTVVGNYKVSVVSKSGSKDSNDLFFLNLGGYKPGEFEEFHYKVLTVAGTVADAVKQSTQNIFYKHFGFKGAESHIDDKFGIDLDDAHKVGDLLDEHYKQQYSLVYTESDNLTPDMLHIGYVKIDKVGTAIKKHTT